MKKLIILLLLITATTQAQRKVSLSLHQDLKLATIGDKERGYDAFTTNILARFKMQGNQQKHGYMIVFPEFELADIEGTYKRYSANVGYTFNNLIVDRVEATSAIGWGFIDRYDKAFFSFSAMGELAYGLNDKFKISLIAQFTERKDLKYMWNDNAIRFSGFVGIEYNLN